MQQDKQTTDNQTTEERLADIRASMKYYRPYRTAVRNDKVNNGYVRGWYYTEPIYPLSIGV